MKNYGTLLVQRYEIFFILKNKFGEKEGWCVFVGKKKALRRLCCCVGC